MRESWFRPKTLWTACAFATSVTAHACPDGYYNTPVGLCLPNSGTVTRPAAEALTQLGGSALEQWIIQSRNTAINGAQPIPPQIRSQLSPYFSQNILNRARYKTGDNGILNAARTVMGNPDVSAVTLIDVIIFRSAGDAAGNIPLWAHEMKHVQQYAEWGARDFALRYTRDSGSVESPAYALQNQVASNLQAQVRQAPPRPAPGFQGGSPLPVTSLPVRYCQTPAGNCAIPPAMVPMGTSCFCSLPNGQRLDGRAF